MRHSIALAIIFLMIIGGGPARAACSDSGYSTQLMSTGGNTIQSALNGKRILATGGGEEWREDHCASGALYKVEASANDPVDPYAYRGQWSVSGQGSNSKVNYNYSVGGSSNFSWALWQNASGGLCWENSGNIIATAPAPGPSGTCAVIP
jgi:hypothetical protein